MKNTVDAHIEFSYQGKTHSLSSTLDLDSLLARYESFPSLHATMALEHGIDTYSYLYEVMQETEIEFGNAQGIVASLLSEDAFDQAALADNWQELKMLVLLQPIALRELGIADLNRDPKLKSALIQAYNLGRST